ncbi:response regulator [Dinoroseobacter sp. S124A]|uniref:response regulator n=1 Tax=Dinoroseobacter sp. S124A TaxID=3415128 RepID=UPI003C7D85D3
MPEQILICDDEDNLRRMLSDHLTDCGYEVLQAANADELQATLRRVQPALVLLDVRMPGKDGLTALREIRETSQVAVMMLTAAGEVVDKVLGLEFGADDYLVKPLDLRELQARVKSVLRRKQLGRAQEASAPQGGGTVPFGTCQLDLDGARLFDGNGEEIAITTMEFSLLRVFAQNRGRVLNRDQLLDQAHDRSWEPYDRSIDLRISRIRRKVERNPSKPEVIRTVRGLGYVFR